MTRACFYFQVHQPFRLRKFGLFDIGSGTSCFDEERNRHVMRRVADKCYLPMNRLVLDLVRRHEGRFKVSYSISGTALDQMQLHATDALESFQALAATGCVELLAETSHHSLTFLSSTSEFEEQVRRHHARIEALFGQSPRAFRNTELVFSNALAARVEALGYDVMLAEGADRTSGAAGARFPRRIAGCSRLEALLRDYRLSDDIAFRFSDRNWEHWPLTPSRYADWLDAAGRDGPLVNLFMDYETFGEHQWVETGIFDFMRQLPAELLSRGNDLCTVSEAAAMDAAGATFDSPEPMSWADAERDLTAWTGNPMQQGALRRLHGLHDAVMASGDDTIVETWRRLTTSDHLYYASTKWFSDGDVHAYFNPYDSPYEAFMTFMNVLTDLEGRLRARRAQAAKAAEAGQGE